MQEEKIKVHYNKLIGQIINDINDEFRVEIPVDLYGKIGTVDDFAYEVLTLAGKRKAK